MFTRFTYCLVIVHRVLTSVLLARQSGADILSISKRLGHASISITADTYSALFEETDLQLAEGLEKLQQDIAL